MKDPYAALGVPKDADQAAIKRAYRRLTQEFHPDKHPGNARAEERFKEVNTAYEVLGDPDRRKLFDEFGPISLTQGFDPERARAYQRQGGGGGWRRGPAAGPSPFDFDFGADAGGISFDELLSRLYGGGKVRDVGDRFGGRRSTRGRDLEGEITVSLLDSLLGVTVPLRIEGADGSARTIDVKVPAGVDDGQKIRLRGQGGAGEPPGDLLLVVRVVAKGRLERRGRDLHLVLPVTALEAYVGATVDVPTPWGTLALKIPAGSQSGRTLRLRGKGLPAGRGDAAPAGDLLVELQVVLPEPGDPGLQEALERLQRDEDPRQRLVL